MTEYLTKSTVVMILVMKVASKFCCRLSKIQVHTYVASRYVPPTVLYS